MHALTLVLLGAFVWGGTGVLMARVTPEVRIGMWGSGPTKPLQHQILWGVGLFFTLLAADDLRHEIGWWSYPLTLTVALLSRDTLYILQRRILRRRGDE
jgi:hypothetical protein